MRGGWVVALLATLLCVSCRRVDHDCGDPAGVEACLAAAEAELEDGLRERDAGSLRRTRQMIEAALDTAPDHPRANLLMGLYLASDEDVPGWGERNPTLARAFLEASIQGDPGSIEAQRGLALLLLESDSEEDRRRAATLLEEVVSREIGDATAHLLLAELCLSLGQLDRARAHAFRTVKLSQAINDVALVNRSRNLLGKVYLEQGEPGRARRLFRATMMRRNRFEFHTTDGYFFGCAFQGLGELYVGLGRTVEPPSSAVAGEPPKGDPGELFSRALELLDAGDLGEASRHLDSAAASGEQSRFHVARGFVHVVGGEYVAARTALERAERLDPADPGIGAVRGHLAITDRDYRAAEQELTAALDSLAAREGDDVYREWLWKMAHLGLGWASANQNQHVQALEHYASILKLEPEDSLALLGKANSKMGLREYAEAETILLQVLERHSRNQYALAELATVNLVKGRTEEAESGFRAAIEEGGTAYTCPYEGLGLLYLQQGRLDVAKSHFERAIAINPDIEFKKYNGLAEIYIQEGRLDEAEALLRKSLENFPHDDEAAVLLEQVHVARGAESSTPHRDPPREPVERYSLLPLGPYVPVDVLLPTHEETVFYENNIHSVADEGGVLTMSGLPIGLDLVGLGVEGAVQLIRENAAAASSVSLELPAQCHREVMTALSDTGQPLLKLSVDASELQGGEIACLAALTTPQIILELDRATDASLEGLASIDNLVGLDIGGQWISERGLAHLSGLRGLRSLSLANCPVDDEALAHLAGLSDLRKLNIWGTGVTDDGLSALARLTALEELELGNTGIIGPGLEHLSGLKRLRALGLGSTPLSDDGLAHVGSLRDLEELELWYTNTSDDGLAHLEPLTRLTRLELYYTRVTDTGMPCLEGMTKLQQLDLGATQVGDAGLTHLAELDQLERLGLWSTGITDEGLAHLKGMASLRELTLTDTGIEGSGLAKLSDLSHLEYLSLSATAVGDHEMKQVGRLTSLRELEMYDTDVTDDGIEHLARLQQLRFLELSRTRISDAGLAHLERLPNLAELDLANTELTDAGLVHLGKVSKLEELTLGGTQVTDEGLAHLVDLPSLRDLELGATEITDGAFVHLARMPRLQSLEVGGNAITDEGIAHLAGNGTIQRLGIGGTRIGDVGLEQIAQMPSLCFLAIWFTDVTDAGLRHLFGLPHLTDLEIGGTRATDGAVETLGKLPALQSVEVGETEMTPEGVGRLLQIAPALAVSELATF